jgi:hypothetical protein
MRYIKTYEDLSKKTYLINDQLDYLNQTRFAIDGVLNYLGVEIKDGKPVSKYNVDVVDFFKEIFLDKNIVFLSVNAPEGHPYVSGKVKDVSYYVYHLDEFFITVKFYNDEDEQIMINNRGTVMLDGYDADKKPLHKEVEMKKEAENYNL